MPSYFWIKLYHEILHDPKMGRLPDNLWRRVIEIFLLAGENDDEGNLPSIESMAWTLRLSVEELEANLQDLIKCNIVTQTPTGWHVTHYAQRQSAIPTKERVNAHRDREKKQAYYAMETLEDESSNESLQSRYTDIDIELDKDKSKKKSKRVSAEKTPRHAPATIPASVSAYREAAHRYPNKSLYGLIDEHVGSDPNKINFWREVVVRYISLGWNPSNITGQLEWFDRNELPHKNGSAQNKQRESPMMRAIREAQKDPNYGK